MIIDHEKIPHVSSMSSGCGIVEMELEAVFPEIKEEKGKPVIFAAWFSDNLIIVIGELSEYQEIEPDPDSIEQDIFARLTVLGQAISISI